MTTGFGGGSIEAFKDPWARYSGMVYVDGSPAPVGTQVRFRIPSQDEPFVDVSFYSGLHASWSPDSRKIVFAGDLGSNRDIYVMNADGTDQARLS